jgi:hypothetical protein
MKMRRWLIIACFCIAQIVHAQWTWQGSWSSSVNYTANNVVYYNGSSYLCLVGNINVTPPSNPTDWALIAQAGSPGAAGSAAAVSVGYTVTGAPFTPATVTNSGSSSNAILNFTIPQGDAGGGYPGVGSNGANGLNVIGIVNAAGFDCSGSPISTGCLADWTNAGVVNGQVPVWNSSTGKWTPGSGSGTGSVNAGTAFSPAFYPATGTTVGGTTPFTGIGWWSTSTAPAAATASQVVGVIGSTAVTNASNLANTGSVTTNAAFYPCLLSANSTGNYPCNTNGSLAYNPSTQVLSVPQIYSTVATGTPPFIVTSTTPVTSLNIGGNAATATSILGNGSANQVWGMDGSGTVQGWRTVTSGTSTLNIGSTAISGGTNGYILYDNSGVLGNLATTGAGSVVLQNSPTITGTLNGSVGNFSSYMQANGVLSAGATLEAYATNTASVSSNFSSPIIEAVGNYWNGSASASDEWDWQDVLGTGVNPTTTYTLSHSGSSGTKSVSIPFTLSVSALEDSGTVAVGATTISQTGMTVDSASATASLVSVGATTTSSASAFAALQAGITVNSPGVFGFSGGYFSCTNAVAGAICYAASTIATDATTDGYAHTVAFNPQVVQYNLRTAPDASGSDYYGVATGMTLGPGIWPGSGFRIEGPVGVSTTYGQIAVGYDSVSGITPTIMYARPGCRTSTCNSMDIRFTGSDAGTTNYYSSIFQDYLGNLQITGPQAIIITPVSNQTATSTSNYNSSPLYFTASAWNGSSASSYSWSLLHNVNASGVLSADHLEIIPPAGVSSALLDIQSAAAVLGNFSATSVTVGGGSNITYRCTTAGTLPVGALTITTSDCGASSAIALTVN